MFWKSFIPAVSLSEKILLGAVSSGLVEFPLSGYFYFAISAVTSVSGYSISGYRLLAVTFVAVTF